ncbi:MAG: hypothetical protein KDE26_28745 [Bacteroidetes bacterium]|nr:hypothetical protein [Bacteroidota bacterium]
MRITITIFFLILSKLIFAQNKMQCKVYQYQETDFINRKLVLVKNFDQNGMLQSEVYRGYKQSSNQIIVDQSVFYTYRDTFLFRQLTTFPNKNDSLAWTYEYDDSGQLVKESLVEFKKHQKEETIRKGCLPQPEDFEGQKRWKLSLERHYQYDSKGRKTEMIQPKISWAYEKREVFIYDKKDRIKKIKTYHDSVLFQISHYSYRKNSYKITHDEYNRGEVKGYNSTPFKTFVQTDEQGRVLLKKQKHISSESITVNQFEYKGGKLIKMVDTYEYPGWSHYRGEITQREVMVHEFEYLVDR